MGFGFAAMLTGPVAQQLMASVGLEQTFYFLGTFYFVIMLLAAQFIVRPNLTARKPSCLRKALRNDNVVILLMTT